MTLKCLGWFPIGTDGLAANLTPCIMTATHSTADSALTVSCGRAYGRCSAVLDLASSDDSPHRSSLGPTSADGIVYLPYTPCSIFNHCKHHYS